MLAVRRTAPWAALLGIVSAWAGCAQASQHYPLQTGAPVAEATGSVSVERIEGGHRLVVIEFDKLPPPERLGTDLRAFVVWMEANDGSRTRAGSLRYDRAAGAGHLMATTALTSFTVRVTGERDDNVDTPSRLLLAERKVVSN